MICPDFLFLHNQIVNEFVVERVLLLNAEGKSARGELLDVDPITLEEVLAVRLYVLRPLWSKSGPATDLVCMFNSQDCVAFQVYWTRISTYQSVAPRRRWT